MADDGTDRDGDDGTMVGYRGEGSISFSKMIKLNIKGRITAQWLIREG